MNESQEKWTEALSQLAAVCRDGQKGFIAAAALVKNDPELSDLCLRYAQERGVYADELQAEVSRLSGGSVPEGTLTGVLHRGWMNLKAVIVGEGNEIIIAECEEGEDETKEAYEKILQNYLPEPLTQLIQKQYAGICESHAHFSSMKKATR